VRPVVRTGYTKFTEPYEGIVLSFYCCIKSLPTFGLGNMVPDAQTATIHPFMRPDGSHATAQEKRREWQLTKDGACGAMATKADPKGHQKCLWPAEVNPKTGHGCFAHRGWKVAAYALGKLNGLGGPLRVTRAYVDDLTERELTRFWGILRGHLPDIDSWPASAQLGLLSMAWGLGPHFPQTGGEWPRFAAAAKRRDFLGCAAESEIRNSARNEVNADLFRAAAQVEATGGDPDVLYMSPSDATPTLPALPDDDEPDSEPTVIEDHSLGARRRMMADAIVDAVVADLNKRRGEEP